MVDLELCRECKTPIIRRRIKFGKTGFIEMSCCEHEAAKLEARYRKTGADKEVVTIPVAVTQDIFTLGGVCTGKDQSYTKTKIEEIEENLDEGTD